MNQEKKTNYLVPFIIITTLFFIFGFVTSLNGILMPYLKRACELSDFVSAFVPFAFFSAYFIFSIPSGYIINKIGYKNGIILGLLICLSGALLFLPAADTRIYIIFLLALGVLAAGITMLQVAANPYISLLGSPEKASSRISLVGTFNSLGGFIGPVIGGYLILSKQKLSDEAIAALSLQERLSFLTHEAAAVKLPYLVLAACLLVFAVIVYFSQLPEVEIETEENLAQSNDGKNIFRHRHLLLGVVAIFMYVGAEVSIADFMIRYGQYLKIEKFTQYSGSFFLAGYGFAAMGGRFIGIFILPKIKASHAIVFSTAMAIVLILISIFSSGYFALCAIMLVGICNAVLWPSIFPLAIAGLGSETKKGSSFLIMAVVGGAIIPLVVGYFSGKIGTQLAYFVPMLCYCYILYYGLFGYKNRTQTI